MGYFLSVLNNIFSRKFHKTLFVFFSLNFYICQHDYVLSTPETEIETKKLYERIAQLDENLKIISNRLTINEKEVKEIKTVVNNNKEIISTVQFELPILQESIKLLEEQLDNQIDRSMRETLILHGIKGNETSWDATKEMLSSFLEELSEGELNKNDIFYSIVRAHRGGKDNKSVYVKFNNHNVMDSVKGLKFKKKGLFINQLRSPKINKRMQEASKVKTELQKKGLFINQFRSPKVNKRMQEASKVKTELQNKGVIYKPT